VTETVLKNMQLMDTVWNS